LNQDGHGPDCEPLDVLPIPAGVNCQLDQDWGTWTCTYTDDPFTGAVVYGSVGCLRVDRDYFPRVPVNKEVRFQISGVVPPDELPSDEWSEGYYRVPAGMNWTTTGLTLGEALQGAQVLNVTTLLTARGDAHPYPSMQNVVAYLELSSVGEFDWELLGAPSGVEWGSQGPSNRRASLFFYRASFPGVDNPQDMAEDGPNATNTANNLPAYRLAVRSNWTMSMVVQYDEYQITGGQYGFVKRVGPYRVPLLNAEQAQQREYHTYRVLGGKTGGVLQNTQGLDYCQGNVGVIPRNASVYVPIPVIEFQTLLRP
jgi:hypothetical protein